MELENIEEERKESFKSGLLKTISSLAMITGATIIISYCVPEKINMYRKEFLPNQRQSIGEYEYGSYIIDVDNCRYSLDKTSGKLILSNDKKCKKKYNSYLKKE